MKNPFQSLRFPDFKKARPTASSEDGQISLPLYENPNQCELFPNDLEAWVRWIEQLDLTCLGYRPVQESGRKVLLELCYRVGWDPDKSGEKYGAAWPSVDTIAENAFPTCKNARRKTFRIMSRLEEVGYVERIERRWPNGARRSTLYRLEPAMRKNALEAAQKGGVSISGQIDTGGVSISKQNDTGGVSISPQIDTLTKVERKTEPHPAKRGGISVNKSDPSKAETKKAKAWLRKKGVLALKYAAIAAADPEHWKRVQDAAHAHPEAGPGLIVGWLKDPTAIPKRQSTRPKTCRHGLYVDGQMYKDDSGTLRCEYCDHCDHEMETGRVVLVKSPAQFIREAAAAEGIAT